MLSFQPPSPKPPVQAILPTNSLLTADTANPRP
jgi:hypothetical protein